MKSFILCLLSLFFFINLNAQVFKVGLKTGVNFGGLYNDNNVNYPDEQLRMPANAPVIGLSFAYAAPKLHSVVSGVAIKTLKVKRSGTSASIPGQNGTFESERNYKFIEIPLIYRITTPKTIYFEVGVNYSLLTYADFGSYNNSTHVAEYVGEIHTDFYKNSMGIIYGVGFEVDMSNKLFWRTGLYINHGLSDINGFDAIGVPYTDVSKYPVYAPTQLRSVSLEFGLGLTFGQGELENVKD